MSSVDHDVIALLLMMLLGMTLSLGVILTILVCHWVREKRLAAGGTENVLNHLEERPEQLFQSLPFPSRWLAIRTTDLATVQAAFGLDNPTPCSWTDGMTISREHKLFLSPPVDGWILVLGSGLPDPAEDVDACYRLVMTLSGELGEVQYFSANRVLNHHAWARVIDGHVLRAYAWAGHTLWNQGELTGVERGLNLRCFSYAESDEKPSFPAGEPSISNSEKVFLLASKWSVDPVSIEEKRFRAVLGITGDLMPRRY